MGRDHIMRWAPRWLCALALGCTGTDYVADPPPTMDMGLQPVVRVTPDMAAVEVGSSQMLEAVFLDETGAAVDGVTVQWMVSNGAVAAVDEAGVVRGLREGRVEITARVGDVVSDPVQVSVVADPAAVALVRVSPSSAELMPGETTLLSAQTTNSRGEPLERSVEWTSSDEAVATVDVDGRVTAVAPGEASIRAATDGVISSVARVLVLGAGRTGAFRPNPNSDYACEGTATLQASATGGLELAFGDDFVVNRGPGLAIFLSPTNRVGPGSVELGRIQAFAGAQTYAVPDDVSLTDFDWVIIHCVPFNVSFGWAELR